jgi:cell wall-associated NlpC family hydrolase
MATLLVVAPGVTAHADPTIAELEKQIDDQWNQLEPTIEKYNQVHSSLKVNQVKAAALQKKLNPLQLQVDLALSRVSAIATQMYKGGQASMVNALLAGGSPGSLADRLTTLDQMARRQREQINNVVTARDKYAADKKPLDDLVKTLAEQDADLAARKKTIEKKINDLQQLRIKVYGSTTGATGVLKPVACPYEYDGGPGGIAAKKACSLIGKPYIWAAAGPYGYDCSGLTLAAWKAAGVTLRHYTGWQWDDTRRVARSDLRPGDLVFFFSDLHHMGLYVGGGWMVHAPQTGDHVRMARIDNYPIAGYGRPG